MLIIDEALRTLCWAPRCCQSCDAEVDMQIDKVDDRCFYGRKTDPGILRGSSFRSDERSSERATAMWRHFVEVWSRKPVLKEKINAQKGTQSKDCRLKRDKSYDKIIYLFATLG
uniref:Uncharacterized protein n=1 Tax=Romanomermis culicivorax TaxID=13658 RepID=A0A915JTN8_ROMCU